MGGPCRRLKVLPTPPAALALQRWNGLRPDHDRLNHRTRHDIVRGNRLWFRRGLRRLACSFGLRCRRTRLTCRGACTWSGHATGRSLIFASIVLFKFGFPRWAITEATATPTRVFLCPAISDDFVKERARSYLDRSHSRWFHSHHCNCHHYHRVNHSRTLHSVRHYYHRRRRTHRYRCQHTWIGWPWPFCVPGESFRRRREVRPALLNDFAL